MHKVTTTVSLGFIFLALILVKFIIVSLNSKGKPFKIRDDRRRAKATSDDLKGSSQMNHEDRWIILRFTVGFFVIGYVLSN